MDDVEYSTTGTSIASMLCEHYLMIVSFKAENVIQKLRDYGYELKGGKAPETFPDGTSQWYQSAEQYLKNNNAVIYPPREGTTVR